MTTTTATVAATVNPPKGPRSHSASGGTSGDTAFAPQYWHPSRPSDSSMKESAMQTMEKNAPTILP